MTKIIRTIRLYTGRGHAWLQGERVVVIAVHRGEDVLSDDPSIGEIHADDWVEFAPLIAEEDGSESLSWASSDTPPNELGPVEGEWKGPTPRGGRYARQVDRREVF